MGKSELWSYDALLGSLPQIRLAATLRGA